MRLPHLLLVFTLATTGCFIIIEDDGDEDATGDTSVNDTGVDTRDTSLDTAADIAIDSAADTATDTIDPCDDPTTRSPIRGVDLSNAIFFGRPALPASERPDSPTVVTSFADYGRLFAFDADDTGRADGALDAGAFTAEGDNLLAWSVWLFFANGGAEATILPTSTDVPTDADMTALAELDGGLLVVPGLAAAAEPERQDGYNRIEIALNEPTNKDVFFVGDIPAGSTTADLNASTPPSFADFRDDRAALYVPWVEVTSAVDTSSSTTLPPSGAVAGVYARTDATRGIWKAPAGTSADVRGVRALAQTFDQADLDTWNQNEVNALRVAQGQTVVWGARTRQSNDPEWQYVSTRRLAMYIEKSIEDGTEWAAFDANDEDLWALLEGEVDNFLLGIWRDGGLQGARPDDAYFVRVDRTTTTASDIADGVAVIELGFAPLRPAEFIVLRIEVPAGVCL